jgi:hypothetical protein
MKKKKLFIALILLSVVFLHTCKAPEAEKALSHKTFVAKIVDWEQDQFTARQGYISATIEYPNGWRTFVLLPEEFKNEKYVEILMP